jgi:riboflavin biosynthesis pyrimidine reductase
VRQLLPDPLPEVDPVDAYAHPADPHASADPHARAGAHPDGAPTVRVGMVVSADGSATDEAGWTNGLGGPADLRVFRALRAWADAILVGATTVRTGRMGPHRPAADIQARRLADGRAPAAAVVVVSGSLRLDWSHRLFTEATTPTIVVTHAAAASTGDVPSGVPLVVAGDSGVDLAAAVRILGDGYGLTRLLCEGGPTLTTALFHAGLVDELCLSLAPTLLGGAHHTPLLGALPVPVGLRLHRVYEDDGVLFLRYRVR